CSRRDAPFKAVANGLLGQFATDEHQPALAWLALFPRALMIALKHHMHALEHVAIVIAAECEDALGAQDLLALGRHQLLQPRHELVGIERLVAMQRQGLHVLVVIVLHAVTMAVVVIMMMIMVVMMMLVGAVLVVAMLVIVVVLVGREEFRLQ